MARPQKSDLYRRNIRREIRLTSSEDAALEQRAQERGMTMSDFLRQAALQTKPRLQKAHPDRAALIKSLAALGKIGGNVNQIAKALNQMLAAGHPLTHHVLPERIGAVLHNLHTISDHLINQLTNGDYR